MMKRLFISSLLFFTTIFGLLLVQQARLDLDTPINYTHSVNVRSDHRTLTDEDSTQELARAATAHDVCLAKVIPAQPDSGKRTQDVVIITPNQCAEAEVSYLDPFLTRTNQPIGALAEGRVSGSCLAAGTTEQLLNLEQAVQPYELYFTIHEPAATDATRLLLGSPAGLTVLAALILMLGVVCTGVIASRQRFGRLHLTQGTSRAQVANREFSTCAIAFIAAGVAVTFVIIGVLFTTGRGEHIGRFFVQATPMGVVFLVLGLTVLLVSHLWLTTSLKEFVNRGAHGRRLRNVSAAQAIAAMVLTTVSVGCATAGVSSAQGMASNAS